MDFQKEFTILAEKYNLNYQYQDFKNCFGGNWWVYTHSLYNDSGCFTIHCLPQRGEVDCYFTEKFSTDRKELCGQIINVFEIEKDIWNKNERIWIFKKPFYYWNPERIIKTLIQVIEISIEKNNEFFGVKIDNTKNEVKGEEVEISADDSNVRIFVVPTNEELMIARETLKNV